MKAGAGSRLKGFLLASTCAGLAVISSAAGAQTGSSSASDEQSGDFGEIVVTATRQASTVNKVPLSIAAFNQEALDQRGARQVDDVFRFTPGVTFGRGLTGASSISIRGIASGSGAATPGVYIDDTPVASRSIGFQPTTIYPAIFDLERVEVLRGPQGTLFGAGSAGGTVRFITPQPSLTDTSIYGRAEIADTEGGDMSYEAGVAVGLPLVTDKIGIRLSAWHRRDGGYVDHIQRTTGVLRDRNSDWQDTNAVRIAVAFAPTERLTITPSFFYQHIFQNDQQAFMEYRSDPKNHVFINDYNANSPFRSSVRLPALNVNYDLDSVSITGNVSYYDQDNTIDRDYGDFLVTLLGGRTTPATGIPGYADYVNQTHFTNSQKIWSNELRIASANDSWIKWVVGTFYQKQIQKAAQYLPETQAAFAQFVQGVTGKTPQQFFAVPDLVDGLYSTRNRLRADEKQFAIFGETTIEPIEHLKFILGARYSINKFDFYTTGEGPYTGTVFREGGGTQKDKPFTPKIGVEYEFNDNNRLYATAAKGYRAGGANQPVNARCGPDLAAIGYTASPDSYKSDSVWSYEVGSKNRIGKFLTVNASAYWIDWSNIQQSISLRGCGASFVANVGKATSKGFDLDAEIRPVDGLTLQLAVGYTKATYDESITSSPNTAGVRAIIINKGNALVASPWKVATALQYDFDVKGIGTYVRADYQYTSPDLFVTPGRDPAVSSYNPYTLRAPAQHYTTFRIGAKAAEGFDVSLFVNNLFDTSPLLGRLQFGAFSNRIDVARTLRPRTFGLTLTYRD